jgi:hypothetical protein
VYSMPKKVASKSDVVAYKATLKHKGDTILFTDQYDLKVNQAPRDAYARYKACNEARATIPRQRVILTRDGKRE